MHNERMTDNNDVLHSDNILGFMGAVLSTVSKNVRQVVGPSTFFTLMGAPIGCKRISFEKLIHSASFVVIKSFKYCKSDGFHNFLVCSIQCITSDELVEQE